MIIYHAMRYCLDNGLNAFNDFEAVCCRRKRDGKPEWYLLPRKKSAPSRRLCEGEVTDVLITLFFQNASGCS